jgi:SAM-dependent methyltransferase
VGSKDVSLGPGWINLDKVAGPEVDVVGDAHHLDVHFKAEEFDAVVMSAVLQYCEEEKDVVAQVARVLRPGGIVIVNAPFMQPVCPEIGCDDLKRFTPKGLTRLFENGGFEVLELGTALGIGSVMAMSFRSAGDHAFRNRYLSAFSRLAASWMGAPFARLFRGGHVDYANALYLVGRRKTDDARVRVSDQQPASLLS